MNPRLLLALLAFLSACDRPAANSPALGPPSATAAQPEEPAPPSPIPSVAAPPSPAAPTPSGPFVGRFAGKRFVLELGEDLRGSLAIGRRGPFPATARRSGDRIDGTFEAAGTTYPFGATREGDAVILEADGRAYRLEPVVRKFALRAGIYRGSLNGLPATLTLRVEGEDVRGSAATRDGYTYGVHAQLGPAGARGTLTDPGSGRALPLALRAVEDGVELEVSAPGKPLAVVHFRRGQGALAGEADTRDEELVGTWTQAEASAGLELATFQLGADGTYIYGTSRAYEGETGQRSSAGQGQVIQGRWRTRAGVLYTQPTGLSDWIRYAAYGVDGDRLELSYEEGREEVWVRRG